METTFLQPWPSPLRGDPSIQFPAEITQDERTMEAAFRKFQRLQLGFIIDNCFCDAY